MKQRARHLLRVVEDSTGKIEKEFNVTGKSDRHVERLFNGLNINLNHDRFSVVEVREEGEQ